MFGCIAMSHVRIHLPVLQGLHQPPWRPPCCFNSQCHFRSRSLGVCATLEEDIRPGNVSLATTDEALEDLIVSIKLHSPNNCGEESKSQTSRAFRISQGQGLQTVTMNTPSYPSISRRRPGTSLQLCRLTSHSSTVTVLHGTHGSKPPTAVSCTIVGHRFHLHTARQPSKHEPRCRPPGSGQCPGWDSGARTCAASPRREQLA